MKRQHLLASFWFLLILSLLACNIAGLNLGSMVENIRTATELGGRQANGQVYPLNDTPAPDLLIPNLQTSGPIDVEAIFANPGQSEEILGEASQEQGFFLTLTTPGDDKREIVWEYQLDNAAAFQQKILLDETNVYLAAGSRLTALNRADGQVRWETALSDQITPACPSCLQKVDGMIVLLTADRMLSGLDPGDGQLTWEVRLNNGDAPTTTGFRNAGEKVLIADWVEEKSGSDGVPPATALFLFEAKTGQVAQRLEPTCPHPHSETMPPSTPSFNTPLVVDSAQNRLYLFFEGWQYCLQAFDSSTGQPVWEQTLEDIPLPSTANIAWLVGENQLYLFGNDMSDTVGLLRINPADGEVTPLSPPVDYRLEPLGEQNGLLLALATRTRGTERYELWALDGSGQPVWQHPLEVSGNQVGDPGPGRWTIQLTEPGLVILQIVGEGVGGSTGPYFLQFERLDPLTGQVSAQARHAIDDGFWTGTTWTEDAAYLTVRNVLRVDLATGELAWEWPLSAPLLEMETD